MSYSVQNLLHTSLTIEDIGITLQSRGIQVIPDQVYTSSNMLKEYSSKRWVQVSFCQDSKPMPIWPFSKPKPLAPVPIPPVTDEVSVLKGVVNQLDRKISELLQALRTSGPAVPVYLSTPTKPAAVTPPVLETLADPIFIPSKIVPDGADFRIQVDESESDKTDFDSNLDALKNMRKRK